MARRRTVAVAATLQRILASTLPLTAGAGGVAIVACTESLDHADGSMADAPQTATHQEGSTVDSGDASPADTQPEDSSLDSGEGADTTLACDVGYLSCCFEACSCHVPPVVPWIACGGDAEAGACPSAGQTFSASESQRFCPGTPSYSFVRAVEAGAAQIECNMGADTGAEACGRRPRGFVPSRVLGNNPTARYLTRCAQLEAASIDAFEILGAELKGFGAPRRLVRSARRAARDEIRHARTMTALAGRQGATAKGQKVKCGPRRSLRAVAIENAVEGCVRETYGAVVAMWQAQTAADPRVRRAMRRIGADEAQHAQLAWDVQRWADAKLSPTARRAVERARQDALVTLRAELQQSPAAPVARALGLPPSPQALTLLDRLANDITTWAIRQT
jgi:hypothetical protein